MNNFHLSSLFLSKNLFFYFKFQKFFSKTKKLSVFFLSGFFVFREKNENVFLLKERNYALESQLERFRVRCEDHDELKSENELLSKQLKQLQANHNNRATADVLKIEVSLLIFFYFSLLSSLLLLAKSIR